MTINKINPIQTLESIKNSTKVENTTSNIIGDSPFAAIYNQMIDNVKETQAQKDLDAYNLAMGNVDDLHNVMINAQKAETALQLTVSVTNKAINAYNEIMKMNI